MQQLKAVAVAWFWLGAVSAPGGQSEARLVSARLWFGCQDLGIFAEALDMQTL